MTWLTFRQFRAQAIAALAALAVLAVAYGTTGRTWFTCTTPAGCAGAAMARHCLSRASTFIDAMKADQVYPALFFLGIAHPGDPAGDHRRVLGCAARRTRAGDRHLPAGLESGRDQDPVDGRQAGRDRPGRDRHFGPAEPAVQLVGRADQRGRRVPEQLQPVCSDDAADVRVPGSCAGRLGGAGVRDSAWSRESWCAAPSRPWPSRSWSSRCCRSSGPTSSGRICCTADRATAPITAVSLNSMLVSSHNAVTVAINQPGTAAPAGRLGGRGQERDPVRPAVLPARYADVGLR